MDASHNLGAPSVITWCRSGAATLKIQSEKIIQGQTHLQANYLGTDLQLVVPFTDLISVNNTITCLLTLLHLQVPLSEIQEGISQLRHLDMRMQIKKAFSIVIF